MGVSLSSRRGGGRMGLFRIGGGERNRGETGHRGASPSRMLSRVVGDFWGINTLLLGSAGAGRLGVVAADSVFDVFAKVGTPDLVDRAGLSSCWLFFRDLVPEAREALDLTARAGDDSLEARGDGITEEAPGPWDGCDVCLVDGQDSVLLVGVTVLVVDSRESVGCEERLLASVEPLPIFALDLSMAAYMGK
jgi:hypothetical protein